MLAFLRAALCAVAFVSGASLYSFLNVVAYRAPRGRSVVTERSACPACGHTLGAPDLVPVFSWLVLRGRCRHCGAHVSPRYVLLELLGGGLLLLLLWLLPPARAALCYLAASAAATYALYRRECAICKKEGNPHV